MNDIKQKLIDALPDTDFTIEGEGCNLQITAVGECFASKRKVQRQQMVLAVLKDEIANGSIHAATVVAKTPDE
tara:strand:- start:25869 stop:26087 length:219 start_codon:yes stop_codon:yes gene_type:complete